MSGSRIALPDNALKVCASCGTARGTKTKGWGQITKASHLVGWTCPDCPRTDEPIRLKEGKFYAVVGIPDTDGYRSALSSLLDLIGDSPARELMPDEVEAAMLQLATTGGKWKRPLSHRSLIYALGGLRQVYAHALRSGWVKANPAAVVKAPGASHDDGDQGPRRWTKDQLLTFRAHVDALPLDAEPWLKVGMRLTLCGMRRSEVLGLDWTHVNRKSGEVRIVASRTKDGRGSGSTLSGTKTANSKRTVPAETIHPGTAAALRELWLAQGRPTSGLVIVDRDGEPVQPDAYSRRFRALCSAAGVPYIGSIHNTRHTVATILKEADVPDNQAAALLGHDVATYRRFYLVTDDAGAAAAAERSPINCSLSERSQRAFVSRDCERPPRP